MYNHIPSFRMWKVGKVVGWMDDWVVGWPAFATAIASYGASGATARQSSLDEDCCKKRPAFNYAYP